jgi:hypothetical protein
VAPGLLDLLRPSYEHAVQNLPGKRPDAELPTSEDEALGNHLLLFYRHGFIDLGDDLLTRFFARADQSLRYSVMVDAVRGIQQVDPEEVGQVVDRLCSLWEWRYDASVDVKRERHHELSSFAWWFLKDAFDTAWRLQQLCRLQKAGIALELDGPVLEKLDALAGEHLPEALSCLEAILHNRRNDRWGIYDDHVRALLQKALASGDAGVRAQAESLVQYVGSLGFPSFRDLLRDAGSDNSEGEGESR